MHGRRIVVADVGHVIRVVHADQRIGAVLVSAQIALRDAIAESGRLVALPEERALVIGAVGDHQSVILAADECVAVVIDQTDDAARRAARLADHIAAVDGIGDLAPDCRNAGNVADAGVVYRGKGIDVVAFVHAVLDLGVAVRSGHDTRSAGYLRVEVPVIGALGDRHHGRRVALVRAEADDAAHVNARRAVLGVAARRGRQSAVVDQFFEPRPVFVGEGESHHADGHADIVGSRPVEGNRSLIDYVAHGGFVNQTGHHTAVGARRRLVFERAARVENQVLHHGLVGHGSEESPRRGRLCGLADHLQVTDRMALSVEISRKRSSRSDRKRIVRQLGRSRADRRPLRHLGQIDVVQQHHDALVVLPRSERLARIHGRRELDQVVGRADAALRREGVKRLGHMLGAEYAALLGIGGDAGPVDILRIALPVGRVERKPQPRFGLETPDGEFDRLGLGQNHALGEVENQAVARTVLGGRQRQRFGVYRPFERQKPFESPLVGRLDGQRLRRARQLPCVDTQFDDREDIAEGHLQRTFGKIPRSGQPHERHPRRIALRLRVERNRPLGLHGDHPFDSRCGIVGRQRLRSVVVGDAGFARESGRRSRFRGRVFIGRAVVNDRDAVARLPSRFALLDVRAGRGRTGGHDHQPVGILISASPHRLRQIGRLRAPCREENRGE